MTPSRTRKRPKPFGRPSVKRFPTEHVEDGVTWLQVAHAARRLDISRGRMYQLLSLKTGVKLAARFIRKKFDGLIYVRADDVQKFDEYRTELRKLRKFPRPVAANGYNRAEADTALSSAS